MNPEKIECIDLLNSILLKNPIPPFENASQEINV
jgi:hypothetical protein